jgi:dTMP kinase
MNRRTKFIVFEGLDHVGKTTQIDKAEAYLKSKGVSVLRLREPGGTEAGEEIRELLLKKRDVDLHPKAELMLFFAARFQLLETRILPAIREGKAVLLDRYYYSTAAYQGPFIYGSNWVLNMAEEWLRLTEPDLVVYLDGDPELLAKRAHGEADRIEAKGLHYQQQVRQAYLGMAERRPDLFATINAAKSIEEVWDSIRLRLDESLEIK